MVDHFNRCERSPFVGGHELQRPAYLIDAVEGRLVDTSTLQDNPLSYITLSYVHGAADGRGYLAATKENIDSLQKAGAFFDSTIASDMAPTFRDALELVRLLEYRYIWIPALCVVQNDFESQAAEAEKLRGILLGGVVAITQVWDVDGSQGIRGIKELTNPQPRNPSNKLYPWSEVVRLDSYMLPPGKRRDSGLGPSFAQQIRNLQETVLPRRQLRFYHDHVEWRCNTCWIREETGGSCECNPIRVKCPKAAFPRLNYGEVMLPYRPPHWSDALALPWFSVDHYFQALRYMAGYDPSGSGDVLEAAANISSALGLRPQAPFICGMPEERLDIALLFAALGDGHNSPERRQAGPSSQPELPWPSWSWAGWTGGVVLDPSQNGDDYFEPNQQGDIIPIVEWYASDSPSPDAPQRRLETRLWDDLKQRFQHSSRESVPAGWTREQNPWMADIPRPRSRNAGASGFDETLVYKHKSGPDMDFVYPIPIRMPGSANPRMTVERFLKGKVERVFVYIRFRDYMSYYHNQPYTVWSENGRHVGSLQATRYNDLTRLFNISIQPQFTAPRLSMMGQQNNSDHPPLDTQVKIELVALSKASLVWKSDLPSIKPDGVTPYNGNDYEAYYNVMWIEWADGVACRKGIGHVTEAYWDELIPETIDLVLG
ncbi:hypothetical protein GQ53DRAFT_752985, partial [Thozetella sp. PMI_491]